jgi:methylmalonyl-CoA epimerase
MGPVFLNHIGIAVNSTENLQKLFKILNLTVEHSELVQDQGVATQFIPLPLKQTSLELLKPIDETGAVAKFLAKRGPGVHHLSFQCGKGELKTISETLRSSGYELLYPEARKGAHNMLINFIHPKCADGLLIEVMEPNEGGI